MSGQKHFTATEPLTEPLNTISPPYGGRYSNSDGGRRGDIKET